MPFRKNLKKTFVGVSVASLVTVGAIAVGATPAQAYPQCSTGSSGRTGTATCVANGTPYLFQVAVKCERTAFLSGTTTKQIYGPQRAGGQSSSATCEEYSTVVWVGVIVQGG
ncbi:hypothetical protein DOE76_06525 [Leifsonia sp. ku-ls]|nr:hypothetical protein DOE76_06525 [Leifsonia sp. ku-ls]